MHLFKCVFNLHISSLYTESFQKKKLLLIFYSLRMYNKLVSTYESASTRRFRLGRIDNIRANTPEALEWARAMVDETGNISAVDKLRLFRQAMQAQTDLMIQVNN
jgi:choline O-acetyltransferase